MSTTLRSNDILFNNGTTQSTAISLNYGEIGAYTVAFYGLSQNSVLAAGTVVNGSDLYRMTDPADSSNEYLGLHARGSGSVAVATAEANVVALGLTGTWRAMTRLKNANNSAGTVYVLGLFVRIT